MPYHYSEGEDFSWPFLGDGGHFPITQGFGALGPTPGLQQAYQYSAAYGFPPGYHIGLDIGAPAGTRVEAIEGGTVESAGWTGYYRPYPVAVREDDGDLVYYGHMLTNAVKTGDTVKRGQLLGTSGREQDLNGNVTSGDHLHLEIIRPQSGGGQLAIDPWTELSGASGPDVGNGTGGTSGGGGALSGAWATGGLDGILGRAGVLMGGLVLAMLGVAAVVGFDNIKGAVMSATPVGRAASLVT